MIDLSILHQDDGSSKNKRGVLPKHATNVMRSWLFQHIGVRMGWPRRQQDPQRAFPSGLFPRKHLLVWANRPGFKYQCFVDCP